MSKSSSAKTGPRGSPLKEGWGDLVDVDSNDVEKLYGEELERIAASRQSSLSSKPTLLRDVLDISEVLSEGGAAMVDDSFLRCFTSRTSDPWNWNIYLWPAWALGVIIRWVVLLDVLSRYIIGCRIGCRTRAIFVCVSYCPLTI